MNTPSDSAYPISTYWRPSSKSSLEPDEDEDEDSGLQIETIIPPVQDIWRPQPTALPSPFQLVKASNYIADEKKAYVIDPRTDDDDDEVVKEDDKDNDDGSENPALDDRLP